MLRWFVALTPILGACLVPLIVPFTIVKLGIAQGVLLTLILTIVWFVAMLRTSEMPH
tara:strand:- start:375 stop:545 length:171 start_codon:yes stop_codon:yes gene_type:complete